MMNWLQKFLREKFPEKYAVWLDLESKTSSTRMRLFTGSKQEILGEVEKSFDKILKNHLNTAHDTYLVTITAQINPLAVKARGIPCRVMSDVEKFVKNEIIGLLKGL